MPGSGTCTFIDPDDYQASLDRTPLDLLLVNDRGEFKARVTTVRLHHLYLFRSEEDFPRIAYISLAPGFVFVGFAASASRAMVWGGVELQPGEIVLHSHAERFHQRTDGSCSLGLIGLAEAQLERYSEAVVGKAVGALTAARILRPALRNSARLLRLHAQVCRLAEKPKIIGNLEVARALEQRIIHALMTCLQTTRATAKGLERQHHRRIMIRFEEVLAEHLSQPLHIQRLSKLIGVGDRTCGLAAPSFSVSAPPAMCFCAACSRRILRCARPIRQRRASRKSPAPVALPDWGGLPGYIRPLSGNHLRPRCTACLGRDRSAQYSPNLHSRSVKPRSRVAIRARFARTT